MLSLILSFTAGLLTTLSPCVLPILPIVVGGASNEHKLGPLALTAGLTTSFTILGVLLTAFGNQLGISSEIIRALAAGLMVAAGVLLLLPILQGTSQKLLGPIAAKADQFMANKKFDGWKGQFALGLLLGAVWSPCIGPTLGAAIGLASQGENLGHVTATMMLFGIGASIPLIFIAYGSKAFFQKNRHRLMDLGGKSKPVFGAILIVIGAGIFFGYDKVIEAQLLNILPDAWVDLTTKY